MCNSSRLTAKICHSYGLLEVDAQKTDDLEDGKLSLNKDNLSVIIRSHVNDDWWSYKDAYLNFFLTTSCPIKTNLLSHRKLSFVQAASSFWGLMKGINKGEYLTMTK